MHLHVTDWLDLGAVLGRSLAKVRALRGGEARAQGLVFLFGAMIVALFAWHFDLQPTIQWMGNGPAQLTGTLPGDLALFVPALTALLYLAPTILGIGLPKLAADFKFAALLHIFVAMFDAVTDFPTVQATMDGLRPHFDAMNPIVGWFAWYGAYAGLWALATEGFELICIVCAICGVVCIWNSFVRGGAQGARI